jgi:hypothetical protein
MQNRVHKIGPEFHDKVRMNHKVNEIIFLMNKHAVGFNDLNKDSDAAANFGESTISLTNTQSLAQNDFNEDSGSKTDSYDHYEYVERERPKKIKDMLTKQQKERYKDIVIDDDSIKIASLSPAEKMKRKLIEEKHLDVNKQKREFGHMKLMCRNLVKEGNCITAQDYVCDRIQFKADLAVKDITRWGEFATRRDEIVAKFIRAHKRNYVKIKLIKLIKSIQVINIIN